MATSLLMETMCVHFIQSDVYVTAYTNSISKLHEQTIPVVRSNSVMFAITSVLPPSLL